MPVVIKKPVKVDEQTGLQLSKDQHEVPFDGGQIVSAETKPYEEEDFLSDLKFLAKMNPKREALAEELKALATKVKELDLQTAPIEERVLSRMLVTYKPAPADDFETIIKNIHVHVSKDTKKREITDLAAAKEVLGEETFMKLASLKLGDIDKYTTVTEQAKFLTQGWTGKRKVVVSAVGKGTIVPKKGD